MSFLQEIKDRYEYDESRGMIRGPVKHVDLIRLIKELERMHSTRMHSTCGDCGNYLPYCTCGYGEDDE